MENRTLSPIIYIGDFVRFLSRIFPARLSSFARLSLPFDTVAFDLDYVILFQRSCQFSGSHPSTYLKQISVILHLNSQFPLYDILGESVRNFPRATFLHNRVYILYVLLGILVCHQALLDLSGTVQVARNYRNSVFLVSPEHPWVIKRIILPNIQNRPVDIRMLDLG